MLKPTIPFVILDNQDITRVGMRGYISLLYPDTKIVEVGDKKSLTEALIAAGENDTSAVDAVVVLDYALSDFKSVDELQVAVKRFSGVQWILFSHELSESFFRRVSGEDNISVVLKENGEEEIVASLRNAVEGERYICRQIANLLAVHEAVDPEGTLTHSEIEILKLIARGKSVKEIAAERFSSTHTIITHKKNIFRKLGVNNVYEATKYAIRAGIVEMMEYYI